MISAIQPYIGVYRPRFGLVSSVTPSTQLFQDLAVPYSFNVYSPLGEKLNVGASDLASATASAKTIAMGDLHGSFHKLFETLIATGLVNMPAPQVKRFTELTHQALDKQRVKELQALIPSMQWQAGRQLILMGDIIGDRGPIDTLTLDIIEHLRKDHPDRIINIASNHDHGAFDYWMTGQPVMFPAHQASMMRALILAEDKNALREKYARFLSHTKLMHYQPETQALYVHTPLKADTMKSLFSALQQAGLWHVPYEQMSAKHLPDFVETANRFYRDYLVSAMQHGQGNWVAEKFFSEHKDGFLWVRSRLSNTKKLPFYQQGVRFLVHGHDQKSQYSGYSIFNGVRPDYNVVNLDQEVRKGYMPCAETSPLFLT